MKPLTKLFRFLKELVPRRSVEIPDGCSNCKHCKVLDKYSNGFPVKYCNKFNMEIQDRRTERPIGYDISRVRYCCDFEKKN